ncbi:hypothetical protein [Vreelandella venusta]|uniref:hypothetical protein n=1 Tax=Vreelandella venusta TaxID=44935 RepID=UPI003AA93BD8
MKTVSRKPIPARRTSEYRKPQISEYVLILGSFVGLPVLTLAVVAIAVCEMVKA